MDRIQAIVFDKTRPNPKKLDSKQKKPTQSRKNPTRQVKLGDTDQPDPTLCIGHIRTVLNDPRPNLT
jgi:hypothetical protein